MAVDAFLFWIPPDLKKSLSETLAQEEERGHKKRSDGGNSEDSNIMTSEYFWKIGASFCGDYNSILYCFKCVDINIYL